MSKGSNFTKQKLSQERKRRLGFLWKWNKRKDCFFYCWNKQNQQWSQICIQQNLFECLVQVVYNSQLNYHTQHMSSPPRISFNKSITNANPQPYSLYSSGLPNNGYQSYEARPTTIFNSVTAPVQVSQKPQTVIVERSSVVEQIPRPQYEKSNIAAAPSKRLAPDRDPVAKSTCCTPCLWILAAFIGLAGLTLALLYGLNVIGGTDSRKVAAAVSPQVSSATTTNPTSNTTKPTSTTTTTPATINPTSTSTSSSSPNPRSTSSTTTTTNSGSTTTVASSTSTPVQPATIPSSSIPAVPVTTTSHFYAGESHLRDSNEQQRHRLSVNE